MDTMIYKICSEAEWQAACRAGVYSGSDDDRRDGFIHFSTRGQLAGTLARHFAGRDDLVVVVFDADRFGSKLRWEAARDGSPFPHLYDALDPSLALSTTRLTVGTDGRHILTEGLD